MKHYEPRVKFKIMINKDLWTVRIFNPKDFNAQYGACDAITEYKHKSGLRLLSFQGRKVSKDTIAHELTHAYLSYKDFSRKSYGQIEEETCEVMGKHHKHLYRLVGRIYKEVRK